MISKTLASNFIFLPVILFIGFITSFEDFKEYKIKNKWIIFSLVYSFSVYLFVFILNHFNLLSSYLIFSFDKWCINFVISSLVAYLLWYFKMWGAGDAKLFICYVALIPIGQYSKVYFSYYFASFLLLAVIFVLATVFLTVKTVIFFVKTFHFMNTRNQIHGFIVNQIIKSDKVKVIKILLGFFFFFLLFKVVHERLYNVFGSGIPGYQNVLVVVSLLAFRPLADTFNRNIKFIIFALIILIIYVVFGMVYPWQQFMSEIKNVLGKTLLVMVLFPALKRIIDLYVESVVQKTIPFAIWMFLGVLLIWFL